MNNEGWFKIWRKIWDNDYLRRNNTAFKLFIWCISRADITTHSFTTGRFEIEHETGIKAITAYKTLKNLEKHKMCNTKSNNRFTLITILNYEKYQTSVTQGYNNNVTTSEQQSNNNVTHIYKNKELRIKNKNKEKSFSLTEEQLAEYSTHYPNLNIKEQYAMCQDYLLSSGKTYKDYEAMFRNWLRRAKETAQPTEKVVEWRRPWTPPV